MTVVNFNNITGINSITAVSNTLNFYEVGGSKLDINADLTGNVTGNLTGNVTGNVTGGITTSQITVGDSFIKSGAVGLGTTDTTGRNAGVGTAFGTIIYNSTTKSVEAFGPQGWVNVKTLYEDTGITATGGVISDYTDPGPGTIYRTHVFTSSGTFDVSAVGDFGSNVEYLVVAGGGGGGNDGGGGGGGGGVASNHPGMPSPRRGSAFPVSSGSYTVTVGSGGNGGAIGAANGSQGNSSSFDTVSVSGGGYGGGNSKDGGA